MENNVNGKLKLPRAYKRTPYITGDAQRWTYQYTWEDWDAAIDFFSSEFYCEGTILLNFLIDYFAVFPWFVQEHQQFKNCTLGYIRAYMKKKRREYSYPEETQEKLHEMWKKMQEEVQDME